jgi:hypothetical protein
MGTGAGQADIFTLEGSKRMKRLFTVLVAVALAVTSGASAQTYLGQFSSNRYDPLSTSNRFGTYGSQYSSFSVNNAYGQYGSRYSPYSATNPYAAHPPRLLDSSGNFRGTLSTNRYDPNSISNPYGIYGSRYSPFSVNNPYGAGNRFSIDSPMNPFGSGWSIFGR